MRAPTAPLPVQRVTTWCLLLLTAAFAPALGSDLPGAKVVTCPAPGAEGDASQYRVEVNGRPVDVYPAKTLYHDKKYYFASFDFSGEVAVRVTSPVSLRNVVIRPASCGIAPSVTSPGLMEFAARRPFKISIERDGENSPLLLFGNSLEKNAPKSGDSKVVYFGPGIHKPGKICLTSNQTLYVAAGAVVKGGVAASGENIQIRGRGIIDGNDYAHGCGPTKFMLHLDKCRNLLIEDVILRGAWLFTVAPCGCDGVTIDNVKICGSRVNNDDGIDPINSSRVTIRNCFLRTDDDCIAIKGLAGYSKKDCEHISVTDCSLWTDRANIFRIGYESEAGAMQDITARNIDVLHCRADSRPPETFWAECVFYLQPSNNMPMRRLRFEDFRINADGSDVFLVKVLPMRCRGWGEVESGRFAGWDYKEPGRCVMDCHFKDLRLEGKPGSRRGLIYVAGADAQHRVEDIAFENVLRFGEATSATSPQVIIGPHTKNIRFLRGL